MSIKSILAITDLSPRENMAVQRAWQLAQEHRAAVTLMYAPAHGERVHAAVASRLANTARQLEESLELPVSTVPVAAGGAEDLVAQARGMDLVVLPHRQEQRIGALLRGQPALRLLRHCDCPVLVTRRMPSTHYERILVAVNFSPESETLVKRAAGISLRAELEIFHAVNTLDEGRLRFADASEHAIRTYRERALMHAQGRMFRLTDTFDTRRNPFLTVIGRGDPGRQTVIQQEHSGADLVVVGKRQASAWQDFLCGSVAHRVLGWGTSDVLVVPHARARSAASAMALDAVDPRKDRRARA